MVKKMVLFTCILSILFTFSSCGVDKAFRFYIHIQLLWKTENTDGMITNNVLVTEDTVYAGIAGWRKDTESGLLAIDRKTGKFKWKVPVELTDPYSRLPTPVYYDDGKDGIVLFGGGCHFLAVNAKTGEIIWHFNGLSEENKKKYGFKDEPWDWRYFEMTPVIYKDMVIADTYGAGVFAFDIKTGKIIWWIEGVSGGTHRGDMLIRDGVVYELGSWWASAIKAETGEIIWDGYIGFGGDESSPCMGDGKLYIGGGGAVGAVDMKTGDVVWEVKSVSRDGIRAGCLYYKGKVYIGSEKLWAFDAKTGKLIWEAPVGGIEAAPVEYEGKIYVLDNGCTLWCLDPDTGKIEWSENIEQRVVYGDITIKDDIFYAGGGRVWAFKIKK